MDGAGIKRRVSTRFDRIPTRIVDEVCIDCPQDYMQFVPCELEEPFTFREFAKMAHIRPGAGPVGASHPDGRGGGWNGWERGEELICIGFVKDEEIELTLNFVRI